CDLVNRPAPRSCHDPSRHLWDGRVDLDVGDDSSPDPYAITGDRADRRTRSSDDQTGQSRAWPTVQFDDGADIGRRLRELADERRVGHDERPDHPAPVDLDPFGRTMAAPRTCRRRWENEPAGVTASR